MNRFELLLSARGRCDKTRNRYQGLMIRPVFTILSAATLVFLTACESDQPRKPHPKEHHQFGYTGDQPSGDTGVDNGLQPSPAGAGGDNGTGPIAPPPPSPPAPPSPDQKKPDTGAAGNGAASAPNVVKKDYPYAQPVPNKPGFVTSPYAPYSGYVDVRGFPPGTEVKDPYTQKVFLVP